MSLRNERVRKTLIKEIADIIQKDLKLNAMVSVTDVEVSHDNSFAKVFFSVLAPNKEEKEKTAKAVIDNTPKIRYEIGKRIRLRLTPELKFCLDESLERGSKITDLINKISKGEV